MRRFTVVLVAGVVGTAALAGCSSDKKTATVATTVAAASGITVAGGAAGTPVVVTAADTSDTVQTLTAAPASVKAGPVTFTLTNTGTAKKHEMVVLKSDAAIDSLAVDPATNKVSEDTTMGEVAELDPGKTGSVTIDLPAGKYILVCNIEKHYAQGMRTAFTVA
jgi:uncharacterized cupredoxin-like copper-binding protein